MTRTLADLQTVAGMAIQSGRGTWPPNGGGANGLDTLLMVTPRATTLSALREDGGKALPTWVKRPNAA